MTAPFVHATYPQVASERSAHNVAAVAVAQGLAMQRMANTLARVELWLNGLPDDEISAAARHDGIAIARGEEPEPGRGH